MKTIVLVLCTMLLLGACKGKKLIVLSKGPAQINTKAKTITAGDGGGHDETSVNLGGGDMSFKITSPAGEGTLDLQGDGVYIVNAKTDTVIGGYRKYGDPKEMQKVITQEELKHRIDSMMALLGGKASETNRTFFILPNKAAKISENMAAMVVGPYHRMRSAEKVDGKYPEIYHFYSIKEFRENIAQLQALTVAEKK
jgi:hypothetical protein